MRNTIKALAVASAAMLAAGAASAADIVRGGPRPVMVAPVVAAYNWTGFYLGVQGGWDGNHFESSVPLTAEIDVNGGLVGVYGGYNVQFNNLVLGLDASIAKSWASNDSPGGQFPGGSEAHMNWKADVRGRLGVALDWFMLYAAAGVAGADATVTLGGGGGGTASASHWGWTAGIGGEMVLTRNLVARLEYKYSDYGNFNFNGTLPVQPTIASITSSTVTIGLALKM